MEIEKFKLSHDTCKLMANLFSSSYMTNLFLCWKTKDDLLNGNENQLQRSRSEPAIKYLKVKDKLIKKSKKKAEKSNDSKLEGLKALSLKEKTNRFKHEIVFVFEAAIKVFTEEELKSCHFPNALGNCGSKLRQPFDFNKIKHIKEELAFNFKYKSNHLETVWNSIRSELNKRITSLSKKKVKNK